MKGVIARMLSLQNIKKKYNKSKTAVDDVTLDIMPGEIFGLLGPNGAGKSTTIKLITDILPLDGGTIIINNHNIETQPDIAKLYFGYVPDNSNIFSHLSGIEYLNFLRDIYKIPKEQCEKKIVELAAKFNMEEVLNKSIQSYSHGMKQKIIVIGSLLHNPKVWILDEPLIGLDPIAAVTLKKLMEEHASNGNTVLFSTHILEVAEQLCDRVGVMNKGKLIFVDSVDNIKEKVRNTQSLEQIFLELIGNGEKNFN